MRKKIINIKGSSLVEILVGIALFASVSVPILSLFLGSAIMIKQSRENTKIAEIERHIKADVVYASNGNAVKLHKYTTGNSTPEQILELPSTSSSVTLDGYGILDYEYSKIDIEYKYSVTGIPTLDAPTNILYEKQVHNNSNGKRYKIDIYKLKSMGIDRTIHTNFKLVKTFFIETTT